MNLVTIYHHIKTYAYCLVGINKLEGGFQNDTSQHELLKVSSTIAYVPKVRSSYLLPLQRLSNTSRLI